MRFRRSAAIAAGAVQPSPEPHIGRPHPSPTLAEMTFDRPLRTHFARVLATGSVVSPMIHFQSEGL